MEPNVALFEHAKRGYEEDLQQLLDTGKLNPGAVDGFGNTPLHYAAAADHTKCVAILLDKGAPIDFGNKSKETPLHKVEWRRRRWCCCL